MFFTAQSYFDVALAEVEIEIEVPVNEIEVPENPHPEFKREWYQLALDHVKDHYEEISPEENAEFTNFTKFLDDYMQNLVKNLTNVDHLDISNGTKFLNKILEEEQKATGRKPGMNFVKIFF